MAASPRCRFGVTAFFALPLAVVLTLHTALLSPRMGMRPITADATDGSSNIIDAIYNFGDSISDTGNILIQVPTAIVGNPPYGETLGKPTGRSCNGLLMIDYFAKFVDLPYLSPYLDNSSNFNNGVNFAVAGATALDRSFFLELGLTVTFTNSSLSVQLQWFKSHLNSICTYQEECKKKFQTALFFVGEIGGNDYNYGLVKNRTIEEVKAFVPLVIGAIVNTAKELLKLGAVHLVVPGNFPFGCFPCYLALPRNNLNHDERDCIKDLNELAQFHNDHLQDALHNLRKDHPDVTIKYADYYNAFLGLLDRSDDYGFDQRSLFKACCGTGGLNNCDPTHTCGTPGVPVCPDPSKFISWDGLHLTQEAYKNMAAQLFSENLFWSHRQLIDM